MCSFLSQPPAPPGMVAIPAGTNKGIDPDVGAYSLTVEAFFMDATEVTKAKWDEVYTWALTNGYTFVNAGVGKAPSHPVHGLSWFDCVKWCNARSQKEGRVPCYYTGSNTVYKSQVCNAKCNFATNGYRLPTVTEWKYAARGGLIGKRFPWGDVITHKNANYRSMPMCVYDNSPTREYHPKFAKGGFPYTSPVGSFSANGYGLYDMAGNVFEWCDDMSRLDTDRRICGGDWNFGYASMARCAAGYWIRSDLTVSGFRAACR